MSSPANALLRSEIERFGYHFHLTRREREILALLVAGHANVPQIASRLGLSTNTVHNHFKNIFKRTQTNTKTGLMALFIERGLGREAGSVRRVPHVLLVEPRAELVEPVMASLEALGMRVYVEPRAGRLHERVAELALDALVVDPIAHSPEGRGPLATVQQLYGGHPRVIFAWPTRARAQSGPLVSGFQLPDQVDGLALAILSHCAGLGYQHSRPIRVTVDLPARLRWSDDAGEHDASARLQNVGPGGAHVVVEAGEGPRAGAEALLEFELEGDAVALRAEVVWARPEAGGGLGLRFSEGAARGRQALVDYCLGELRSRAG